MRKHLIWAVIGGLVLPITLICVAADVAAIRNISMLHRVAVKGADRSEAPGSAVKLEEMAAAKAAPR